MNLGVLVLLLFVFLSILTPRVNRNTGNSTEYNDMLKEFRKGLDNLD